MLGSDASQTKKAGKTGGDIDLLDLGAPLQPQAQSGVGNPFAPGFGVQTYGGSGAGFENIGAAGGFNQAGGFGVRPIYNPAENQLLTSTQYE